MKRKYDTPDLEFVVFSLKNVCNDLVVHASNNTGWGFGNDDDDDFGGFGG